MRIFMIEYFDQSRGQYSQEYFRSVESMAARMLELESRGLTPDVDTVFLND